MIRPILPVVALAILLSPIIAAAEDPPQRLLHVTGTGTASAIPDIAQLTLGATADGDTAKTALDASSAAVEGILAALKAAGVEDRDIQTSRLDLSPVYGRDGIDRNTPPRIQGYRASNQVSVTVRELDGLGALLDAVATAGATDFRGIRFALSDPAAAEAEARRAAVADARARATLYAEAAGVALGEVVTLSEGGVSVPRGFEAAAVMAADARSVPVATGEASVRATVNMTFAID